MGVPHIVLKIIKGVIMEQSIEVGDVWIAKDQPELEIEVFVISGDTVVCKLVKDWGGYVKGELVTYTKNTLFRIYAKEIDKACFDAYQEGYRFGHSDAKKEYEEKYKSEFVEVRQHHYDMGYNDALAHMASEKSENALELKKQGYEEGYDGGFEDGYNTAIKEVSNSQALGETTEYEFGTEGCCEHHNPNKKTQEAMQEVSDKFDYKGIWVSKDNNPDWKIEYHSDCGTHVWVKVLSKPDMASGFCVGDLFTLSKSSLRSEYIRNVSERGDEQLEKELALVKKYPHYYKDIRHLNILDIYRFFDLFEVTDPCLQHSIKKQAVGGKRGSKDYKKDIKEAMDTLNRWEYMQEENERKSDE